LLSNSVTALALLIGNVPTGEFANIVRNSTSIADDISAYILSHVEPIDLATRTGHGFYNKGTPL
jgi:hypothetical protein